MNDPDAAPGARATVKGEEGLLSTSLRLLRRAQAGDRGALDDLFSQQASSLRRWAHGRLPGWARHLADTGDLVQDVLMATFRRLDDFEPRRQKALQSYLRQAVRNQIRDVLRRAQVRSGAEPVELDHLPGRESPFRDAVDAETRQRYSMALAQLDADERELIVGHVELGFSHEQLALSSGKPSADAARMALRRSLLKLATKMRDA